MAFGDATVLDNVSFAVPEGAVTGLVGPNGAGKSTLFRVILGLQRPDRGHAKVSGRPLRRHACPLRAVGVVADAAGADPRMSPRAFLRYVCAWAGLPASRVDETLALTSADGYMNKRIGSLSTGMRQRVMLAAALLGDPRCLLLDEPQNGLDPDGVRWLRGFLREFAGQGRSVLVSSHMLAEVKQSVDNLVVLNRTVRFAGQLGEFTANDDIEDAFAALVGGASR